MSQQGTPQEENQSAIRPMYPWELPKRFCRADGSKQGGLRGGGGPVLFGDLGLDGSDESAPMAAATSTQASQAEQSPMDPDGLPRDAVLGHQIARLYVPSSEALRDLLGSHNLR